jgi:DNA polymerase-3 subunit epsilon
MMKSAAAPTSSSRRAATYPQLKRRCATLWLASDSAIERFAVVREIVFDTETTGLNPAGGDRMVEIGCVEIYNRVETGRHFHAYFNPERAMPSEAEAIHGLTTIFLSDKPPFADRAAELIDFIEDSPLVAHNATFDFGFLNFELERCGRPSVCMSRMVDTLALARARHPGAKHSLDALCVRFGVDRSQRIKHGALLDAQLLAQVYVELMGGRQIGLGLVADTGSVSVQQSSGLVTIREPRPPRPHAAGEEELERHRAFIAQLVNPLWAGFA